MKTKKLYEIKLVIFVEMANGIYDDDLITFHSLGESTHDALFKLMKRDLTQRIVERHNSYKDTKILWDDDEIIRIEFVDLLSIKEVR